MVGVSVEISPPADSSHCQNSGAYVTDPFGRVFGDQDDVAHRCGECDSYRRLIRGSAAGVNVSIPDHSVAEGHHGNSETVMTDGRGQMTAGWLALAAVLVALFALPVVVVMAA